MPEMSSKTANSFFLFCQEFRSEVKESNPFWSNSDVTSELGKRWRDLPAEERKKYTVKAKKMRDVSDSLCSNYFVFTYPKEYHKQHPNAKKKLAPKHKKFLTSFRVNQPQDAHKLATKPSFHGQSGSFTIKPTQCYNRPSFEQHFFYKTPGTTPSIVSPPAIPAPAEEPPALPIEDVIERMLADTNELLDQLFPEQTPQSDWQTCLDCSLGGCSVHPLHMQFYNYNN